MSFWTNKTGFARAIAELKAVREAREAECNAEAREREGWLVVSDETGQVLANIPRASHLRVSIWHADGGLHEIWKGRDR